VTGPAAEEAAEDGGEQSGCEEETKPALMTECFENSMASEGSRGVIVSPVEYQCAMCAAIARWTSTKTRARTRLARERAIVVPGTFSRS